MQRPGCAGARIVRETSDRTGDGSSEKTEQPASQQRKMGWRGGKIMNLKIIIRNDSKDKDSQIVNDPNDWAREHDDPKYILNLLKSIITVSIETVKGGGGAPRAKEKKQKRRRT